MEWPPETPDTLGGPVIDESTMDAQHDPAASVIQAAVESIGAGTRIHMDFASTDHFGKFQLMPANLPGAMLEALHHVYVRFPDVGRKHRSLLQKDIIAVIGADITVLAISESMHRHLPSRHMLKWADFFPMTEKELLDEAQRALPFSLKWPEMEKFLVDDVGFVRPRAYVVKSVYHADAGSPESEILRQSLLYLVGQEYRAERERVMRPSVIQPPTLDIPPAITESLRVFRAEHESQSVAFLMMQFARTHLHDEILATVRSALAPLGIVAMRADDKEYHDDLYYNVLTYIHGCAFGIAIFERIEQDEFNPNVSLEVGYLLGLRKPVCLLKDRTLRTMHTDLVGKLYREFDPYQPAATIPSQLEKWLNDRGLVNGP